MRHPDWENRLSAGVEAARHAPFAWGSHDCATWAFGVRRDLTGQDDAVWRGQYRTARGARKWLMRAGFADLESLARSILGEPVRPLMAHRGDIVLSIEGPAFGVCVGSMAAFLEPGGMTFRPLRDCMMAWRV